MPPDHAPDDRARDQAPPGPQPTAGQPPGPGTPAGEQPAAVADLIATLAHELRSPLTSIKGFSATLLRRWDRFDDDAKRHMLSTITHDADRAARLIGQLLDVARLEAGRLELRPQPCDLADLAAAVAADAERDHPGRTLQTRFPAARWDVYADADKIRQALGNLVEYLVQHTDGPITLTGEPADATVEVAVRGPALTDDTGAPAPPEHLRRLFTRPQAPAHTRRDSAVGGDLGLYVTRGLIRAHRGHTWARTTPGRGTELRFRLPR